jgi:pimeloyl-ACP methyl ester carboxylesterase
VDRDVRLPDGRTLLVRDDGNPSGPVILSIHGSGMGRTLYAPYLADMTARGARAISYDRPGLGGSTRRPGYTIADTASDVREIAVALRITRLGIWGASAGGMPALACGVLAPDLVAAVALFAPGSRKSEPWADPESARAEFASDAESDIDRSVDSWIERLSPGLPSADLEVLKTSAAEWFAEDAHDALRPGGDGCFDEEWAMRHDWGFLPEDATIPVLILQGKADPWVDPADSEELARRIPTAELRLTENDGHLSPIRRVPEVNAWLLSHLAAVARP